MSNLKCQCDDFIVALMTAIESRVKAVDNVKFVSPLAWVRALDELEATKNILFFFIAMTNGLKRDAAPLFLSSLNEMW